MQYDYGCFGKKCGRNQLWPIIRCHPGIFLEDSWSHTLDWNQESSKHQSKEHGDCMNYFELMITDDYCDLMC